MKMSSPSGRKNRTRSDEMHNNCKSTICRKYTKRAYNKSFATANTLCVEDLEPDAKSQVIVVEVFIQPSVYGSLATTTSNKETFLNKKNNF